ncbi:tRNA pseudouridine(38-40) synthase TruA [Vallitaleaceae bacterium 9-2]
MNIKMRIAYDGTRYSGWQRNKNASKTIQHKLDETLSKYFEEKVQVIGAGRTDKGVHAKGMVANFHLQDKKINLQKCRQELNVFLPEDIAIVYMEEVFEQFHSRFNAVKKTYSYTFYKAYKGVKPIFGRQYMTALHERLNMEKVRQAIELIQGTHDFAGFSSDKTKKSTVRTIESIKIIDEEDYTKFIFTGDGFLYHMIRILMGTLIEVGRDTRELSSIVQVFENKERAEAGFLVEPSGLALEEVFY